MKEKDKLFFVCNFVLFEKKIEGGGEKVMIMTTMSRGREEVNSIFLDVWRS